MALALGTILLRAKVRSRTRALENEIESRKKAEDLERQARKEWMEIFEAIGHPTLILSERHDILSANRAALKATGMSQEELIGKKCYQVFHRSNRPPVQCPLPQTVRSGVLETREMEVEALNGTFLVSCTPVYDATGNLQKVIHIATDITQRKEAQQRLESSEKQFRSLLESIELIAIILDMRGDIIFCNDCFLEIVGLKREDALGRNWFDTFLPLNTRDDLKESFLQKTIETGQIPAHYQNEILLKNNERREVKWSNAVFRNESGQVVSVISIGEDITDYIASQEALQRAEQGYQDLVETINDVVFSTDKDGIITYISPLIEAMTGFSPDEIIGRPLERFVDPRDFPRTRRRLEENRHGMMKPDEYRIKTKSGKSLWVQSSSRPAFEDGQFAGLRGMISDISETRALEEKLLQAQKMEAIGTLAGGIAHDFNNILSAVIGYTELSLDGVPKGTGLHENLLEVLAAGNRAKALTRQILSISRHEERSRKPVQVNPLIKETLRMLRSTIPTSIEIHEKICPEPLIVSADATQIHQVIVNLATNAMHAMSDREGILEVLLESIRVDRLTAQKYLDMTPGHYARLTVCDTGVGIPAKDLDKVFEPYFTTKEKGMGTGLGLSVTHGIVKAHEGHVSVYSEQGKGTTFHVYLPLAQKTSPSSSPRPDEALPMGTEHILLVDDEPPIVRMQQQSLERLGYRVTTRTESREALEAFRASPETFDLVITDMTMPYMTGDKLAHAVKEIRGDIPVILCTGFSEKVNGHKEDLAIDDLLMKPVDQARMANTVRKALDR